MLQKLLCPVFIQSKINVVNIDRNNPKIDFGKEDKAVGAFAIKSLRAATKAIKEGHIDVLVTAPINKNSIQAEDFNFPGHTNFFPFVHILIRHWINFCEDAMYMHAPSNAYITYKGSPNLP